MDFLNLGINHRTTGIEVRESLVFNREEIQTALQTIRTDKVVPEALILSTCNRTEIYCYGASKTEMEPYLLKLVAEIKNVDHLSDPEKRYRHQNRDAVRHFFRIAAGLDSMILGEPQILGQLKQAYTAACNNDTNGPFLNRLCHMGFRVGKQARTETDIGVGAVSVSSAAVSMLEERIGPLRDRIALLIGAGEMGELTARHLASNSIKKLHITSRNETKARNIALRLDGHALPLSQLQEMLAQVDIVISSTSSRDYVITPAMIQKAMRNREDRKLYIIDIAVPRDVAPGAASIEGVILSDIDSLNEVIDENIDKRKAAIVLVDQIIEEHVAKFITWYRSLQAVPIIQSIRTKMELYRQESLEKAQKQFPEEAIDKLDYFSRNLMEKFLRDPMEQIKLCDRSNHVGMTKLDTICDLFSLVIDQVEETAEKKCREQRSQQIHENDD